MPCDAVVEALEDDLNTPKAISALHQLASAALKGDTNAAAQLRGGAGLLGVLTRSAEDWFRGSDDGGYDISFLKDVSEIDDEINTVIILKTGTWDSMSAEDQAEAFDYCMNLLIDRRNTARKDKDFQIADAIRDVFQKGNIVLEDGPDGTTWRRTA